MCIRDSVYRLKQDNEDLNIIINGGIKDLDEAKKHLLHVDGVMIGRASYDNPFMLSKVDELFFNQPINNKKKVDILNEYLDYVTVMKAKGYDLSRMLKHLFGLSKGDTHARAFRRKVHQSILDGDIVKSREQLVELL